MQSAWINCTSTSKTCHIPIRFYSASCGVRRMLLTAIRCSVTSQKPRGTEERTSNFDVTITRSSFPFAVCTVVVQRHNRFFPMFSVQCSDFTGTAYFPWNYRLLEAIDIQKIMIIVSTKQEMKDLSRLAKGLVHHRPLDVFYYKQFDVIFPLVMTINDSFAPVRNEHESYDFVP